MAGFGPFALPSLSTLFNAAAGGTGSPSSLPSIGLLLDNSSRKTVLAVTGAYVVSGKSANLLAGRRPASAVGAFTLTGSAAILTKASLATTGTATPLPHLSMNFIIDPLHKFVLGGTGTFLVTGKVAGFGKGASITAATGSFLVQGAPAQRDFEFAATKGSFVVTGNPITMTHGRPSLVSVAAAFAVVGKAAGLVYLRPTVKVVAGSPAQFVVSGKNANLLFARRVTAVRGTFSVVRNPAPLVRARTVVGVKASYALTGRAASFALTRKLPCGTGAFSVVGFAAAFVTPRVIQAAKGSFTLTGRVAGLVYQAPPARLVVFGGLGLFTVTGSAAVVGSGRRIAADTTAFAVSGKIAGFTLPSAARVITAVRGIFAVTGNAAAVNYSAIITPLDPTKSTGSPVYGGGKARGAAAHAYRGGGTSGAAWAEIELEQEKARREQAEREVARLTAKLQKQAKAPPAAPAAAPPALISALVDTIEAHGLVLPHEERAPTPEEVAAHNAAALEALLAHLETENA